MAKKDERPSSDQHQWGFIFNFHHQYKEIEEIFEKLRHILCMDRDLGEVLPNHPKFIYRKTPNFGDKVVREILDPPGQQKLHIDLKVFFHVESVFVVGLLKPVIGACRVSRIVRMNILL